MTRRLRISIETDGVTDVGLSMIVELGPNPSADRLAATSRLARRLLRSVLKSLAGLETGAGIANATWSETELVAWAGRIRHHRALWGDQ